MIKQITFLSCAAVLLAMAGCHRESSPTCTDGSSNFPFLGVNHREIYYFNDLVQFPGTDTMTQTIVSKDASNHYNVSVSYIHNYFSLPGSVIFFACGEDFYEAGNPVNPNQHWWFSLSSNIGDTWTRADQNNVSGTSQLLSKNATVTTIDLNQTFSNCYEFTFNEQGTINTDTVYFRPDWGLVYYNGTLLRYELMSRNF